MSCLNLIFIKRGEAKRRAATATAAISTAAISTAATAKHKIGIMSSRPITPTAITDEEAVAAADKEMEERANRAKELLSRRYVGLKRQQVSTVQ